MPILNNTVPISIPGGFVGNFTFITFEDYQAVETYYYQSPGGQEYCPCADNQWVLAGGTLPPGLSLNGGTGIISGTTQKILGKSLYQAVEAFPNAISIPGSVQGTFILGSNTHMTTRWDFTVHGLNNTIPAGPTVFNGIIFVLKDGAADFSEDWEPLSIDERNELGGRPVVYY
jgi:hypothetical protein